MGGIGGDAIAFRGQNGAVLADRFTIIDFDAATGDGIDLTRIDADSVTGGDQAFTIGALANGQAGRLQIDQVSASLYRLSGDVDGDGVGDFMLDVTIAAAGRGARATSSCEAASGAPGGSAPRPARPTKARPEVAAAESRLTLVRRASRHGDRGTTRRVETRALLA